MYISSSKNGTAKAERNLSQNAVDTIQETAGKVRETVSSVADKVSGVTATTNRRIHDNPVQSVFIALGVGYVIGKLFGR